MDDTKKHGRGVKETKTEASDFSLLTAIVVDVDERWVHSRRVHAAGRLQAAVVVVNKGRVSTGQAVHRRLVQEDVVAVPGVTGVSSSSTLLVHRDCRRTGGSVMRETALWTTRWVQASFMLPIIITVLVAAAAVAVMVMVIMVVLVVMVVVVAVVIA